MGDIIVIAVIAAMVILAGWSLRKDHKKGGCTGCADCSGQCSDCTSCHKEK